MKEHRRYTVKPKAGKKRKTPRKSWLGRLVARIFSPRNIIIISEHKTEHVPLSIRRQLVWMCLVLSVVGWGSFFTGNYMAAQDTLREKEKMIANSHLKNRRIESEFALLKRDLVSMLDKEKQEDLDDYARFVIQQYRENGNSLEDIEVDLSQLGEGKHGAVFERIAFLEQTVDAMKQEHELVMAAIEETAQGRLDGLEEIIQTAGLKVKEIERVAKQELASRELDESESDSDAPQGGPYRPLHEDMLKEYSPALFNDLKRLIVLDELVRFMPTEAPMRDYHLTSGYGMRIDPIRKKPAHHSGLDFAGEVDAKIYSANDGVVTFSGRRGAYGNQVKVDHGFELTTSYSHLSKILVEKGQKVRKGQVIGIQGTTGRSTGLHLHYEVQFRGRTMNPKPFLKAGKYVQKIKESSEQETGG